MQILAAVKSRLSVTNAVTSLLKGGIWIGHVDQNQPRPNILLEMPESGQDYAHDGPVGMIDAHLIVTSRADIDSVASQLGDEVDAALRQWTGCVLGCDVQLCALFGVHAEFDAENKVFKRVSEYTVFYRRV